MKRCGYTLVELLVVIVVMGILATGLFSVHVGIRRKARRTATLALFSKIETACALYKVDFRCLPLLKDVPTTETDESTETTIHDVVTMLQYGDKRRYLELDREKEIRGAELIDSWGNPLKLHVENRDRFFLVSNGPDRVLDVAAAETAAAELCRRRRDLGDATCDDMICEVK